MYYMVFKKKRPLWNDMEASLYKPTGAPGGGSVDEASDSWFRLTWGPHGRGMEPCVGLHAVLGACWRFCLSRSPCPSPPPLSLSKKKSINQQRKLPKKQVSLTTVLFNIGLQTNLSRLCPWQNTKLQDQRDWVNKHHLNKYFKSSGNGWQSVETEQ